MLKFTSKKELPQSGLKQNQQENILSLISMTFPDSDLAQCPQCDKWNFVPTSNNLINCNKCNSWYEPKRIWKSLFTMDKDFNWIFNYGKHKGKRIREYPDYLVWLLKQELSSEQINIIQGELKNV
jgi:hypothetical protein